MKVLFVCSQNMCRSPYCEYMFARMVEDNEKLRGRVEVDSSAVMSPGTKIDKNTVAALVKEGFDKDFAEAHKPGYMWRKSDRKLFKEADIIIGMTKSHKTYLPIRWKRKFVTLSEAATGVYTPIPDPWLMKQSKYFAIMDIIKGYLELYLSKLEEEIDK